MKHILPALFSPVFIAQFEGCLFKWSSALFRIIAAGEVNNNISAVIGTDVNIKNKVFRIIDTE